MTTTDTTRGMPASRDGLLTRSAYAVYGVMAWILFTALALTTLALVLLLPGMERRRRATRGGARLFLRLAGMPLEVRGLEHLPAGQCVVVANHASYLDGVVMKAVLPPRFAFVVKREMASFPLAGLMLKRIGTEFVERFDRHKGASDARRVMRSATAISQRRSRS
jgi:1-acyl-sn-glycerol-3-phosphate acyltransferase